MLTNYRLILTNYCLKMTKTEYTASMRQYQLISVKHRHFPVKYACSRLNKITQQYYWLVWKLDTYLLRRNWWKKIIAFQQKIPCHGSPIPVPQISLSVLLKINTFCSSFFQIFWQTTQVINIVNLPVQKSVKENQEFFEKICETN